MGRCCQLICYKKHGSYYSCASHGTPHISALIMNGFFRSLSQIYTSPIIIVLSTDITTQMGSGFMSKNVSFGSQRPLCTAHKILLQKYTLLLQILSSLAWPCLILFWRRHKVSGLAQAIDVRTRACWAKREGFARHIWLQCHQAFPWIAQHSLWCISCLRKTHFKAFFHQFEDWLRWNFDNSIYMLYLLLT